MGAGNGVEESWGGGLPRPQWADAAIGREGVSPATRKGIGGDASATTRTAGGGGERRPPGGVSRHDLLVRRCGERPPAVRRAGLPASAPLTVASPPQDRFAHMEGAGAERFAAHLVSLPFARGRREAPRRRRLVSRGVSGATVGAALTSEPPIRHGCMRTGGASALLGAARGSPSSATSRRGEEPTDLPSLGRRPLSPEDETKVARPARCRPLAARGRRAEGSPK